MRRFAPRLLRLASVLAVLVSAWACTRPSHRMGSPPREWRLVPESTVRGDRRQFFVYGERLDGAKVQEIAVGGAEASGRGGRNVSIDGTEVRFPATAGPKVLAVTFVRKASQAEGMRRPFYAVTSYEYAGDVTLAPAIGSVELRGPYDVTGPGQSPSRQRIFTCRDANERCARQIVSTLARRAFRRPVTDRDIDPLMDFYRAAAESAQRAVLRASPLPVPPDKYETFRNLILSFSPREMLGIRG